MGSGTRDLDRGRSHKLLVCTPALRSMPSCGHQHRLVLMVLTVIRRVQRCGASAGAAWLRARLPEHHLHCVLQSHKAG